MVGQEKTCQFHWSQAQEHHTKQFIKPEFWEMHKKLCYEYRKCRTKVDADTTMEAIKAWWFLFGAVSESDI